MGQGLPGQSPYAEEVNLQGVAQSQLADLLKRPADMDARVVDQQIDGAASYNALNGSTDTEFIGNVKLKRSASIGDGPSFIAHAGKHRPTIFGQGAGQSCS